MRAARSAWVRRSVRVSLSDLDVRLGAVPAALVNMSATGALVRTDAPFLVGRACPLHLELPDAWVRFTVRIVRADTLAPGDALEACAALGVMFTEYPTVVTDTMAALCGPTFHHVE